MIVRAILQDPSIADNFDHFNDHKNTLWWLLAQPETPERNEAIARLKAAAIAKGLNPNTGW